MTELEIMQRAQMYMEKLSRGMDPITDRSLPQDTALNNPRLARCFAYVSDVLQQVIRNGGQVGQIVKTEPFSVTPQILARVMPSETPISVSRLLDRIMEAAGNPEMKRLPAVTVTNWLTEKGFLQQIRNAEGKNMRVPTENGRKLGIYAEYRQNKDGEYCSLTYSMEAQRFVLDNLMQMIP